MAPSVDDEEGPAQSQGRRGAVLHIRQKYPLASDCRYCRCVLLRLGWKLFNCGNLCVGEAGYHMADAFAYRLGFGGGQQARPGQGNTCPAMPHGVRLRSSHMRLD